MNNKTLNEFLSNFPLYRKYKITDNELEIAHWSNSLQLSGQTFTFYCKKESQFHTFELAFYPPDVEALYKGRTPIFGHTKMQLDEDHNLNFIQHYTGICKSCNKYSIDFLLHVFSDFPLPFNDDFSIRRDEVGENKPTVFIKKIGQYPPYEITPSKDLINFLNDEDKENYKKALMNMSTNYGIGAFAYFRRILENEIKRIIQTISEFDFEDSSKVKVAYEKYTQDRQMSNLIDTANKYLPESLKELGNILNELYAQLSVGLHSLTDDKCMEKATYIDILLNYIIKKLNVEKYELSEVKKALKELRKK